jgi:succinate-semialdehyde dehydrogenase/glutarate-semialdehyde dehydrogenase
MELGGNAPFIVFDDADLDVAVDGLMVAKFRNTGQSCIGANRALVQDSVYDAFAERFSQRVRNLAVGDGFTDGVHIGPLINQAGIQKLQEHIVDAVSKGARILTGGKRHPSGGFFFEPTVLIDVSAQTRLAEEESFGPLAPLMRFSANFPPGTSATTAGGPVYAADVLQAPRTYGVITSVHF